MTRLPFRYRWLILLIGGILTDDAFSQPLEIALYRVKVTTKSGNRFRGILEDMTENYLYIDHNTEEIPTDIIRKVIIRRVNKKVAIITGAITGGLLTGYLANESLKRNQTNSVGAYGLTLTFAAAGGAAAGLVAGSAIGDLSSRDIRPLDPVNPGISLFRQLEPFSVRYQQDFINRLPKKDN